MMQANQIIQEIDTYLSVYPLELEKPPALTTKASHSNVVNNVVKVAGHLKEGIYFANDSKRDEVLETFLEHCSEETLDELVQTFGEESPIANMIRRKNVGAAHKIECDYQRIKFPLEDMLKESKRSGNPFYEGVCKYMKRIGYENDSDFYNSISMPRQQFARLRDAGNTLSKKTVLWIIVGLRLNFAEASDLLQKAGYFFRKNDMRDVILTYIFRNTTYDLDMVNQVLDHFGLAPFC